MRSDGYIPFGSMIRFHCSDGVVIGFVVGVMGDRENLIVEVATHHWIKVPIAAVKLGMM